MTALLLRNARLLDPAAKTETSGDCLILDGKIAATGPGLTAPEGAEVLDAHGACLAPGLIDLRTHGRDPGQEHKESLRTQVEAAVAGGVTAMGVLPDTDPIVQDPTSVAWLVQRSRALGKAKVLPYAAMSVDKAGQQLTEFGLLQQAGAVAFADGAKATADALVLRRALSYAKTFDAVIFTHPEDRALTRHACATEGEYATRLGLPAAPAAAELMQVQRDLLLTELTGGRLHIGPITTGAAVEAIRAAKAKGVRVTCDTAAAYITLNEIAIADYRTFTKLTPPLRTEADRQAVIAGLADGTIDALSSDHTPEDQDAKRLTFTSAEPGIIGLETLLPLGLGPVHQGRMSLLDLLARLTVAPAAILGLPVPSLAVGAVADLVLFDPDAPVRISADAMRSKSKNTPFDGFPLQGKVLATLVDGSIVYRRAA
ncbi:dihydroorotase [Elstera cyanobacteriorum]|uniref:dihydroorotase n=1 Tax=Elstera cyanobacteriorum TaxID=2022747 RepID=UPI0023522991|nr:dihydroorotase [Elstera cyanobacteriorum]MCK6444430.1 dihydroorotase [Elstera cyanobacteriorum]